MSQIDQRIVQLELDNQDFENDAKTSKRTLQELKESLKMDSETKSLNTLRDAVKSINFNPLGQSVDLVASRFSTLGIIGVTALQNITNKAIDAGETMIRAFTLDPVKTGFEEYETQINAVQTILANTESKGSTLEDVNAALDELNTYADKTIYNFTEMTRNIGTFTAAGVDLETSTQAIKGIANLAAVSGSNSQQASTAMYQLSQALAAGTVKLQDWNSVVNAGMGGEVFQNALKETARVHGIAIDQMIEDEGSFRETLQKGWLSSEVLLETLNKFTGDMTESELKAIGYSEEQISSIVKMGETANDAATKVKTFTQLFDTLSEAVQSGWTQSWELIVGDFEESKELLTGVSDIFSKIIGDSADARNQILKHALGERSVDQAEWEKLKEQGITSKEFRSALKETARQHGVDIDQMIKDEGSFGKSLKNGWLTLDILKETFDKGTDSIGDQSKAWEALDEISNRVIRGDFGNGQERIDALTEAGYNYAAVQNLVNHKLIGTELNMENLSEAELKAAGYTEEQIKALEELKKQAEETGTPLNELITSLEKPTGRELLIESFKNSFTALTKVLGAVRKAYRDVFPPLTGDELYSLIEGFNKFTKSLILNDNQIKKVQRTFKGLFSILDVIGSTVGGVIKFGFNTLRDTLKKSGIDILEITANAGDALTAFRNWFNENNILEKGLTGLSEAIAKGIDMVRSWIEYISNIPKVKEKIDTIKEGFSEGIDAFKEFIERVQNLDGLTFENVQTAIKDFKENVASKFVDAFKDFFDFSDIIEEIKKKFEEFVEGTKKSSDQVSEGISGIKDRISSLSDIFGVFGGWLDTIKEKFDGFLKSFHENVSKYGIDSGTIWGAIFGVSFISVAKDVASGFKTLANVAKDFSNPVKKVSEVLDALSETILSYKNNTDTIGTTVLKIAGAIGILAASVAALSLLDEGKVKSSLKTIGILTAGMAGFIGLIAILDKLKALDNIGDVGTSILKISGSILLIVGVMKAAESLDNGSILRNTAVLIGIAGSLTALGFALSKIKDFGNGAKNMIEMALAIRIMVSSFKAINKTQINDIGGTLLAFGEIIGTMVILGKLTQGIRFTSSLSLISLAVGIRLMVSTLESIADTDTSKIVKNLDNFIVVFGAISAFLLASRFAGKNSTKAGIGLLTMSASLITMASAIKKIGSIDLISIKKGIKAISQITLVYAAFLALTKLTGGGSLKAGGNLLLFSASLVVLSGCIAILSSLDPDGMDNAVKAIDKVSVAFGLILGLSKFSSGSSKSILSITVLLSALALSLGLLSSTDTSGIKSAGDAIAEVIASMAALSAASRLSKSALTSAVAMTAVVGVIAGILYLINGIDAQNALSNAQAIATLVTSLSIACAALINANSNNSWISGVQSATNLLEFIGIIIGVAGALGELNILTDGAIKQFIESSYPILKGVGAAIHEFIEGLVFGDTNAVDGIKDLMDSLSSIVDSMKPFLENVESIGSNAIDGIKNFATLILTITGAEIADAIAGWFAGENNLVAFADELKQFGPKFADFATSIYDVDTDIVDKVAAAASSVAEFANAIPNTGGKIADWIGDNTLSLFGDELQSFGPKFASFASSMSTVNADDVEKASTAAKAVAEFANTVPNTGGKLADLVGDNTLSAFADELKAFGPAFAAYSSSMENVNNDVITKSSAAAQSLTALADTIPNSGGLSAWVFGDNDLGDFSEDLGAFGTAMSTYYTTVKDIDFDNLTNISSGIASLAEAIGTIGSTDSWQVSAFLDALEDLSGEAITNFISAFDGKMEEVTAEGVNIIGALLDGMETGLTNDIADVAQDAVELCNTLIKGMTNTFDLDSSVSEAAVDVMSRAIEDSLTKLESSYPRFTSAGKAMIDALINGMRSVNVGSAMASIRNSIQSYLPSFSNGFYSAGQNMINGMINGMNSKAAEAGRTAADIARKTLNEANAAVGIHSPSTEFRKSGKNSVLGLILGWKDNENSLYQIVGNVMTRTYQNANNLSIEGLNKISESQNSFLVSLQENGCKALDSISQRLSEPFKESPIQNTISIVGDSNIGNLFSLNEETSRMMSSLAKPQPVDYKDKDTRKADARNDRLYKLLGDIGERVDKLENAILSMNILINRNQLIGQIDTGMNKRINQINIRKQRGI